MTRRQKSLLHLALIACASCFIALEATFATTQKFPSDDFFPQEYLLEQESTPSRAEQSPAALKLVETRLPQDEVIYQIMPIAWCDSDNDSTNGVNTRFGDFAGLASNTSLDYLQYLGVTMIYLQPIFPSAAYHGYQHGPADMLNTRFGTQAQFLDFVSKAHARGMKVILDYVAYGISQNSTYFQSAYRASTNAYSNWLAFTSADNVNYVGSVYNTWNGSSVGFIHWNLNNASAVATVTNWAKKWLDPNNDGDTSDGVDGFRLDHVWASGGEGWGANISFWETWCTALRAIKPNIFIFCEPSDWGNYGTDLLTSTAFDAVITKPFEFAARSAVSNRSASGLYSSMANTVAAIPIGKFAVAETNDHDSNRLASDFGSNNARQKVAAAILLTQPCVPNIYYGDEIGMKGSKANVGSDANDIPVREPFKWKAVAGLPMTNYPAASISPQPPTYAANNDGRSVDEQKGVSSSILETYRSLITVRKNSIALRRGGYIPVACSHAGVYAFVRSDASETVLVAINLDSATATGTLNLADFTAPTSGTIPVDIQTAATLSAITSANKAAYPIQIGARSWFIVRVALTTPPITTHPDIDGRNLPNDAGSQSLIASQSCLTSLGDNVGELDQMFSRRDGDALKISITGNIPQDATALALFIDVDPATAGGFSAGQNTLSTSHLGSPPAGLAQLDGLTFEPEFSPDAMYFVNAPGATMYVDHISLPSVGLAAKEYRGSVAVNAGRGVLAGGVNLNGVEVALDNTNSAGITAGSVAAASSAISGIEFRIPFADLGLAADFNNFISLSACLVRSNGALSNQWLPGLVNGSADLGVAANLGSVSGQQYAIVVMGKLADVDGNGHVDSADIGLILSDFGACAGNCRTDLDRSSTVDSADLGIALSSFD